MVRIIAHGDVNYFVCENDPVRVIFKFGQDYTPPYGLCLPNRKLCEWFVSLLGISSSWIRGTGDYNCLFKLIYNDLRSSAIREEVYIF